MKFRFFIFMCFVFFSFNGITQSDTLQNTYRKSVIGKIGLGYVWAEYGAVFEYKFHYSKKSNFKLGAHLGGSYYGFEETGGLALYTGLVGITGGKNSHFEFTVGANWALTGDAAGEWEYIPAGTLGYRYQKPFGRFIWRAGVGWPFWMNAGIGVGFN
ncbi:hypothetical protein K6119_10885 [Paracrocinitomix mangrovi]|uniref:hypothetical protein n=1 Tax=Paracrocinitomix mangrovi TaxID=2862509 RepID=UPI001C8CF90E|nr:hypothetical protein [Paracrocinitomix mangrovi]UKN00238.1 hypothetical protein K6119_10885 [Paracrocinitomix mangrovi]